MSDQGTGITITWGSNYLAEVQSLSLSGPSREAIDISTFATTGGREFVPSDLYDPGELEAEVLFPPGTPPPIIANTAEACTIAWTNSTNSEWSYASAFMTNISVTGAIDERVLASVTLKLSGDLTVTANP